ncbi:hypothetical protein [Pontibacter sp. G13]|uniref:DUF7452 domain-containing protein n=1 Tax=Pontibacter sp. G13 TaxID=3074898 RepID=UPI00288A1CBE|nr:hypothetical protein [Pontibacter sp. G13]WNJ19651.1 hypothetical protein RJD25_04125 [Pontibacter sp. G13]
MKRILLISLWMILGGLMGSLTAQTAFQHTTTSTNTSGHITTLDHSTTNGKAGMIVIVEQVYGKYNDHAIGVWYNSGKWKIFNQDRQPIPAGTKFNILVVDPAKSKRAFVHTTGSANIKNNYTILNHSLTNVKPSATVLVTQVYGRYNTSPVGVWYSQGKWTIYNEKRTAMPAHTKFHVLVLNAGNTKSQIGLNGNAFSHSVTQASKGTYRTGHISFANHVGTNSKKDRIVFATPNYKSTYNPHIKGVWYANNKWSVFNHNRKAIPNGVRFNMLAVDPSPVRIITTRPEIGTVIVDGNTRPTTGTVIRPKPTFEPTRGWVIVDRPKPGTTETPEPESEEEISLAPLGPNLAGEEMKELLEGQSLADLADNWNFFPKVYPDQNEHSGIIYYLPKNYSVQWDASTQDYSLSMYYLSSTGDGRGEVIVTAELTPKLTEQEIEEAEELLSKQLRKDIKLYPMPIMSTPQVSLGQSLENFGVDPSSLHINVHSDFLEPIVLSWKMDQRVDDLIGFMMSNAQLAGKLQFEPYAEEEQFIDVPIRMKLNEPETYGKLTYENAASVLNGTTNPLDYPIILEELSVMRRKGNRHTLETITLGNYRVEPGMMFSDYSDTERTRLIEGDIIEQIWLKYSMDADCETCKETILDKILSGTSRARVQDIELEVLNPIAFSGAALIKLQVRSIQADPNGESMAYLEMLTIRQDFTPLKPGQLMIPEGENAQFEYQVSLVMPTGEVKVSEWVAHDNLTLVLGEFQLNELFPPEMATEEPESPEE